jgi:hypothetical protein
MERGEFDEPPRKREAAGPFRRSMVPDDLRVAYKILKNSGCLPPELELHKEIVRLRDLIHAVDDEAVRTARIKELNVKLLRFNLMKKRPENLEGVPGYREKVIGKLGGDGTL